MRAAPFALSLDGLLAGGMLLACSPAVMEPVAVFADPGKYQFYSCDSLLVSGRIGRAASWN